MTSKLSRKADAATKFDIGKGLIIKETEGYMESFFLLPVCLLVELQI